MAEIKLQIFSKKVNTTVNGKARSFITYWTKMNMIVVGEEEKGKLIKSVTVKFRKNVDASMIKRGYIIADEKDINAPFKYEVKEELLDNGVSTGKKLYPTLWIRGFKKYIEEIPTHTQNDFVTEEESDLDPYVIPDEED